MKPERIQNELERLPEWLAELESQRLSRAYAFLTYAHALAFVAMVGEKATVARRYPQMRVHHVPSQSLAQATAEVEVMLVGVGPAGLVPADFKLARRVEAASVACGALGESGGHAR